VTQSVFTVYKQHYRCLCIDYTGIIGGCQPYFRLILPIFCPAGVPVLPETE
jgi:hypothetical protein